MKSNFDFERHFAIIGCSNVRINHWNIKHQTRLTYCKFKSLDKVWDATKVVLTSPIAGKAKFHFSKINVGSVMSVMFVDIRPGALGSPESTEVHGCCKMILLSTAKNIFNQNYLLALIIAEFHCKSQETKMMVISIVI